jgi:hypothetical protein
MCNWICTAKTEAVDGDRKIRMHNRRSWLTPRFATFLSVIALTSCGGTSDPFCDICTTSAIVYGTVTDEAGDPVVGAPLHIDVYREACTDSDLRGGTHSGVPRTNSAGMYTASVISLYAPFTARCFLVTLNGNADPRWPTHTSERFAELDLRSDLGNEPRDSIRFNIHVTQ